MFTINLKKKDFIYIADNVYEMPKKTKYILMESIMTRKKLDRFNLKRFCINFEIDEDWHYKFIVNLKDGWNYFTVTARTENGIVNCIDAYSDETGINVVEVNEHYEKTCTSPLNVISHFSEELDNEIRIEQSESYANWVVSSQLTISQILLVLRYIFDYEEKEFFQIIKKNNVMDLSFTVNLNKFERTKEREEKEKAEFKKKVREEKKIKKQSALSNKSDSFLQKNESKSVIEEDLSKEYKKLLEEKKKFESLYKEEKRKIKELEEIRKIYEKEHYELEHLRKFVSTSKKNIEDIGIEEKKKAIKGKKILIIGGFSNWHNRLSQVIDNLTVIDTGDYGKDTNVVYSADLIYFFSNYIGHGLYYKFLNVLREHNLDYGYLNTTNLEQNIDQIYKDVIEKYHE